MPSLPKALPSHRDRYIVAAAAVLSFVAWWYLHRWWIMAGDDYLLTTAGGDLGGRFAFSTWLRELSIDWTQRNGRLADSLLRLVLRPGTSFYPLFAPLMFTAVGLALGLLLSRGAERRGPAPYIVGLLAIPTILWANPPMTGDAVLWTAGAINYVLPLIGVGIVLGNWFTLLDGRALSWPAIAATAVAAIATDALMEVPAGTLAGAVAVTVITHRRQLDRKAWVLAAATLAAFTVHITNPGLRSRNGLISEAADDPLLLRLLRGTAQSSSLLWQRTWWLWFALLALLVLLWFQTSERKARIGLLSAIGATTAFGFLSQVFWHRRSIQGDYQGPLPDHVLPHAILACATMAVAFLAVWYALAHVRHTIGSAPLLLWGGFIGSCLFVFGSGVSSHRAHFVPTLLLLLLVVRLALDLLTHTAPHAARKLCWALVVAMAATTATWYDLALFGTKLNHMFVEEEIKPRLLAAQPGGEVILPPTLPAPNMNYYGAFLLPRYEESLKTYYGLPSDVHIITGN